MKFLLLILFPCLSFAQPRKGVIVSKKVNLSLGDSALIWTTEEPFDGKLFVGETTLTINNLQYDIDSARMTSGDKSPIYLYYLSLKGRRFRCYLFREEQRDEWGLLLDNNTSFVLYRLRTE
jgi:hypothetical protein